MNKKMMFDEFAEEVVDKIKEFLPETFANASVSLQVVKKNNDLRLTGLTISSIESNIAPTIYLEKFFEEYENGADMGEILEKIATVRVNNEVSEKFDIKQITDFSQVKNKLVPRLVNADKNADLLAERPHKLIADLAVIYCVMVDQSDEGTATIPVTNSLMNLWNTSVDELDQLASANLPELLPSCFRGMSEVIAEMMGASKEDVEMMGIYEEDEKMWVLSNKTKINGATALLDKEMMKDIAEKVGEFFVLPSSIHEVLIVPKDAGMSVAALESMVREVNATQVAPEEQLSDNVYIYNFEEGLVLA